MEAFVVNRDEVSWRVIDDEAVIIHCTTSDYFALNQSGTWLWELMAEVPRTSAGLVEALSSRYARAHDEAGNEVRLFLDRLVGAGLVLARETAAADPPLPAPNGTPRDGYESPEMVKFGDLETLILSGE